MHEGAPVSCPVSAAVLAVLAAAKDGKLVLCVGAGLSVAADACLPTGARLGELLDERLNGRLAGYESPQDPKNLIAVADAAADLVDGLAALQAEVLELADFKTASPNYGHQALALLLAEGALTALSWNWDTCIERSIPAGELLEVARTNDDADNLAQPQLAKVHGCATMRPTLLITSEQLDKAPVWTEQAFAERIRGSAMVFVGIGDVADYAKRRIKDLLDEFSPPDVRVVSQSIKRSWLESVWAELLPSLPEARRIEEDADSFLDDLARAWARELTDRDRADSAGVRAGVRAGVNRVLDAVGELTAVDLIQWCRASIIRPEMGASAVRATNTGDVVLAAGVLAAHADRSVNVPRPACCAIGDELIELLVLRDRASAADVQREARRRAEELSSKEYLPEGRVRFLIGGTVVGALSESGETPDVLAGPIDPEDVVDGPQGVPISYLKASAVLEEAA